jgi:hypothetical protein
MTPVLPDRPTHRAGVRACGTLASTLLLLAGCASTEPRPSTPVAIRLSSSATTALTASAPLQISAVRLVVTTASLGGGDQFGCVDCQGNAEEAPATPRLVTVPLSGGTVLLATEQVAPGRYSQAEIAVEQPNAATLAGVTNWPAGATIMVEGAYNGKPFQLPLSIIGSFRETLSPPVDVSVTIAPAPVAITITLPVTSWFVANGATLDPTDPAQRATIEANARRGFQPLEAASRER